MATSISFTDGTGAATLTNGKPTPADRFDAWTPFYFPNLEAAHELGSKRRHTFVFGTIYGVRFQLSKIPNSSQETALRLIEHLLKGGTCSVATGDSSSRTYATCTLADGEEPTLELTDRQMLEYTLSLALVNTASSPVRMVAIY
jgi:hypothetical protein